MSAIAETNNAVVVSMTPAGEVVVQGQASSASPATSESPTRTTEASPLRPRDAALTKTKLFTLSGDGTWTEIGVGTAKVEAAAESDSDSENTDSEVVRLVVEACEESAEVLLSTPLVADDIYQVQKSTILVWSDPQLGHDMAASFNTPEGCAHIMDQIRAYQETHRPAEDPLAQPSLAGESSDGRGEARSPWAVCRENLPALKLAVANNKHRFGAYVRDTADVLPALTRLFGQCEDNGDKVGQQHVSDIIMGLLQPPFNTESAILGLLVSEGAIDDTIDMVQHYLASAPADGDRPQPPAYAGKAERRGRFKNPARLPIAVVARAHYLFSLQWLRDLLPLLLDEGDAGGGGAPLAVYILRLRYELFSEVCEADVLGACIARTRDAHGASQSADEAAAAVSPPAASPAQQQLPSSVALLPMLHELSTSVKNAMIPLEPKEDLFVGCIESGLLGFLSACLAIVMRTAASPPSAAAAAEQAEHVSRIADIACHCFGYAGNAARIFLLKEAYELRAEAPHAPIMVQLLRCAALIEAPLCQQALFDAVIHACVGLQTGQQLLNVSALGTTMRLNVVAYIVEGVLPKEVAQDRAEVAPLDEAPLAVVARRSGEAAVAALAESGVEAVTTHASLKLLLFLAKRYSNVHGAGLGAIFNSCGTVSAIDGILSGADSRGGKGYYTSAAIKSAAVSLLAEIAVAKYAPLAQLVVDHAQVLAKVVDLFRRSKRRRSIAASCAAHFFAAVVQAYDEPDAVSSRMISPTSIFATRFMTANNSSSTRPAAAAAAKPGNAALDALVKTLLAEHGDALKATAEDLHDALGQIAAGAKPAGSFSHGSDPHAPMADPAVQFDQMMAEFAGEGTGSCNDSNRALGRSPASSVAPGDASGGADADDDDADEEPFHLRRTKSVRTIPADGAQPAAAPAVDGETDEPMLKRSRSEEHIS
jgi:hypothetical protein